ncbi:MAG TPA: amidase family protein, partial [Promineifilum sp.]|nr:amidase family protein [Promineifilum sp.]
GYKPSFGRVPSDGALPLSPSADTVGWFGGTMEDVALMADVLIPDWTAGGRPPTAVRGESAVGRRPSAVTLGIPDGPYLERASAEGLAHFWQTVRRLEAAGVEIRRVPAMADYDDIYRRHNDIVAYEAARTHARWFDAYREQHHPKTAELIERGRTISEAGYRRALDGRARLRDELHGLMDAHGLDLWIAPAAVGAALPGLESTGDPVMALPWTHAGLPAVSLPAGTDAAGWPMGLQVVGRFGKDEELQALTARLPVDNGYFGRSPVV